MESVLLDVVGVGEFVCIIPFIETLAVAMTAG